MIRAPPSSFPLLFFQISLRSAISQLRPPRSLNAGGDVKDPDSWGNLASCLTSVSDPVRSIAQKSHQHAIASEDGVLHNFELFLCFLEGYESLLQRLEKGVAAKHKQAITRMTTYRKRQISATTSSRGGNAQDESALRNLEQRIIEVRDPRFESRCANYRGGADGWCFKRNFCVSPNAKAFCSLMLCCFLVAARQGTVESGKPHPVLPILPTSRNPAALQTHRSYPICFAQLGASERYRLLRSESYFPLWA